MSKKLSLFTKFVSCLSIVLFLQVSVAFAQNFPMPPKGRMVFELNANGEYQKAAKKYKGFEMDPTVKAAFQEGGVLYSVELVRPCPKPNDDKYLVHIRVLFPDKDKENILITNQREKTASIRLEGKVRRWEKDCNNVTREIEGGDGKMSADFSETYLHSSPRTFLVNAKAGAVPPIATGMFSGAGIEESLRPHYEAYGSAPFVQVAGSTGGNEQAAVLDDPNYMKMVMEAAKKQGVKLDPEKLKEMKKMADDVAPTHSVAMVSKRMIRDKVPAVLVYVFAGSPPDAISGGGGDGDDDDDGQKCDYYLALDGLDTNPGTKTEPFATMQKSLDEAKICRDQNKPTIITVKNGMYHQSASVTWADSVKTPMLMIKGENAVGVIFSATKPPNSAVLPFAIKMTGAKNVTVSNITFRSFQVVNGSDTPGLIDTGSQITLQGVKFD